MTKLNLTQSFVNKAKVEEGITSVDYYDERLPGLLMKVLPSGRKTYYIRYKDKRKVSSQRKLGNAVILTLSDARALARRNCDGCRPFFTDSEQPLTNARKIRRQ